MYAEMQTPIPVIVGLSVPIEPDANNTTELPPVINGPPTQLPHTINRAQALHPQAINGPTSPLPPVINGASAPLLRVINKQPAPLTPEINGAQLPPLRQ